VGGADESKNKSSADCLSRQCGPRSDGNCLQSPAFPLQRQSSIVTLRFGKVPEGYLTGFVWRPQHELQRGK